MACIGNSKQEMSYCNLLQVFLRRMSHITKLFLCNVLHYFTTVCWIESLCVFWPFFEFYAGFYSLFLALMSQKASWLNIKSADTTIIVKFTKLGSLFQYRAFVLSLFFNKSCSYLFFKVIFAVWCFLWLRRGIDWLKTLVKLSKKLLILFYLSLPDVSFIVLDLLELAMSELSRAVTALENLEEESVLL